MQLCPFFAKQPTAKSRARRNKVKWRFAVINWWYSCCLHSIILSFLEPSYTPAHPSSPGICQTVWCLHADRKKRAASGSSHNFRSAKTTKKICLHNSADAQIYSEMSFRILKHFARLDRFVKIKFFMRWRIWTKQLLGLGQTAIEFSPNRYRTALHESTQHAATAIAGHWLGLRSTLRQARHLSLPNFALRLFLNQDAIGQKFCTPILSQETNWRKT